MAGLSLKGIYKQYPGASTATVHDVNLEIADKEFLVLVGPSGCGKSTTLRMIAGLEDISAGQLFIGDRLVNDVPPKDRDIAMVFQSYALYPHMSVYDNMAFGLKLRKVPKAEIERRVQEAAATLGITQYLQRKPKALSGGQRQRVALGRAIVREPQVFLMDEPLSNLDAKLRGHMRAEITKLAKRLQTTVVYVTHDQIEAMTMGDRIVVMKDGYIQQAASPDVLYNHPINLFVAGFIGSPTMNFLNGKLEDRGGAVHFVSEGVDVIVPDGKAAKLKEKGAIGTEVILGIRPEDLHDEPVFLEASPKTIISANIEVAENLGSEKFLYLSGLGARSVIARVDGRSEAQEGHDVKLALDMNRAHFFDPTTTEAIVFEGPEGTAPVHAPGVVEQAKLAARSASGAH